MTADLQFDDVRFSYDGATSMIFDGRIEAGTMTALMGPSGAGKSTLFALLAGFETPESGRILIGGKDVTAMRPGRRPISMVFQDNNLFVHLSVATNVALGVDPRGRMDDAIRQTVAGALARVGLAGFGHRRPASLSGGERQRVALARALVSRRPVLLLDEPFAALGPALRGEMLRLVATLRRENRLTGVMITHRPADARAICDNVMFVENGGIAATAPVGAMFDREDLAGWRRYLGGDESGARSSE